MGKMILKKTDQGQNYFIDFLKFIASLIIVLYHSWVFSPNNDFHFIFRCLVLDYKIKNKKRNVSKILFTFFI